jgi:signal transduction histidine kinase
MTEKAYQQFEFLRKLILKTNQPFALQELLHEALESACQIIQLQAGFISIWKDRELVAQVWFGTSEQRRLLEEMEKNLLSRLWNGYKVQSLYLNLEHEGLKSLFSYPVKKGDQIAGAISGVSAGPRNLSLEEEFVEALGNQLGIALAKLEGFPAEKLVTEAQVEEKVKSARMNAILETAAALNHEINNPLTAVLGNAQLLLLQAEKLTPEAVEKLKAIEESALRIREVTLRLMKIIEPVTVEYASGLKMIHIEKSKTKEEDKDKK